MKLKKHREHYVLFCANTPFKQKVVESKKAYTRKQKHKGREQWVKRLFVAKLNTTGKIYDVAIPVIGIRLQDCISIIKDY